MRAIIIGSIVGVLLLTCAGIYIHQEYTAYLQSEPTTLVVALDITDEDLSLPTAGYILSMTGIDDDIYREITIEFVLATDKEIAPVRTITLEKEFFLLADERMRKKKVYDFQMKIADILGEIENMNRELSNSAIYAQINKALSRLNELNGTKMLIIASNGYEHTEKYSVYKSKKLLSKRFEPAVYAKGLKNIEAPVPVDSVDIVFFMNPSTRIESVYQTNVVSGYRLLYPNAHITIETT